MAAPIVVPFNFSPPVSPSIKTTSYTVPTGKYAQVKAYFEGMETQTANATTTLNSRTITLNGVTILVPYSQGVTGNISGITSSTYTLPRSGYIFVTYFSGTAGGSSVTIGSLNTGVLSANTIYVSSGVSSNFIVGNTGVVTILFNTKITYDVETSATFWAKAGDVITGTGNWRALVTEYNVIS